MRRAEIREVSNTVPHFFHLRRRLGMCQAIMSTRITSNTMANIEINDRMRVRLAPKIASKRKTGASRTIHPAKDLQAITQDQSPASALQLFPKNFTVQTAKSAETAIRFAAPRIRHHFDCGVAASLLRKRDQANPRRKGGENKEKQPTRLNSHKPCMSGEMLADSMSSITQRERCPRAKQKTPASEGTGDESDEKGRALRTIYAKEKRALTNSARLHATARQK